MYMKTSARQEKMTAVPTKYPQGYFKDKTCRWCSSVFSPQAPSHHYCSQTCAEDASAEKYLWTRYKISLNDYLSLYEKQDKKCAICKDAGFKMQAHHRLLLVVDHDHKTGRIRGLLCHNCNRGLGLFQDNTAALLTAVDYLNETTPALEEKQLQEVNVKMHRKHTKSRYDACSAGSVEKQGGLR